MLSSLSSAVVRPQVNVTLFIVFILFIFLYLVLMRNQLYFFFWQFLVAKNKQTDFVAGRGESLLVHFSSAINHKMLQTSRLCGGGIYSMTKFDF